MRVCVTVCVCVCVWVCVCVGVCVCVCEREIDAVGSSFHSVGASNDNISWRGGRDHRSRGPHPVS
jgi:hypothetical protein